MSYEPFPYPNNSSIWTGRQLLQTSDWIYQLPQSAVDEIDASVSASRRGGGTFESIGRADFPLESIEQDLAKIKTEVATGRGFVIIKGLPVERYSTDDLRRIFWGFGAHFGIAMPQSHLGELVADIMDLSDEKPGPFEQRRGYHSGGAQRVHSDATDIVAMMSIHVAKKGGECRLTSAHAAHNMMLENAPGLLQALYDGFFIRWTDSDAIAAGRSPSVGHRVPAYRYTGGWLNCSFARGMIDRAVMAGDAELSPVELAAIDAFAAITNHPDVCLDVLLQPGEMQFINNRTMLHSRAQFEDHVEKDRRRRLLRLWLSVPEWPAMADVQFQHTDQEKQLWAAHARRSVAAA